MNAKQFEKIVADVLDGLPEDFASKLENVEVEVEERPSTDELNSSRIERNQTLLGLYQGVPLPSRGLWFSFALPDRITIFKEPVEEVSNHTGVPVQEMIRRVVLHEIAHHFGMPDSRLRELGY